MDLDQALAQIETLQAEKQASDRQSALFARRETLGDRLSAARQKAELLVQMGKMTTASFKQKFEGKTAPKIAQFAVGQVDQAEAAVTAFEKDCDRLEYLLEDLETNGVAVKFGLPIEGKDLETEDEADKKADEFMKSYTPRVLY